MQSEKNVFIIGSKGIPASYGGFETFVENLTLRKKDKNIKYHVACMGTRKLEFTYNNARCFTTKVPNIGSARAVYYDIMSLRKTIKYIKKNEIKDAIIYILACRIGPVIGHYKRKMKKFGAKLYVNPDGHEWKRAKWNALIRKYWKFSEKLMVKYADLLICDSLNIERYIKKDYRKYNPKTIFIAYGSDTKKSKLSDNDKKIVDWYAKYSLVPNEYYLVVGRLVPENNFETMVREFMKSKSKRKLVLISNYLWNKFYYELKEKVDFEKDKRIVFATPVYDAELLKKIRENAYAYLHGHSVGGTNPSLLESMGTTKLNLLLDVGFNKEVAKDAALYWNKNENNLMNLIDKCDRIEQEEIERLGKSARERIDKKYSWERIVDKYEKLFTL